MLNYDEYRNLCCLINENPDIISVFDNMSMFSIDELSIDSHDIKNQDVYKRQVISNFIPKKSVANASFDLHVLSLSLIHISPTRASRS